MMSPTGCIQQTIGLKSLGGPCPWGSKGGQRSEVVKADINIRNAGDGRGKVEWGSRADKRTSGKYLGM